jgi:hypothetical protein
MKELLTKSFWDGVKKTFNDALEGPPPEESASPAPAEPETPPPPSDPVTKETT